MTGGPGGQAGGEARFRLVLGHFATGVTVVTGLAGDGLAGDEPVGLAVNSFTSVSLEPPLVAFCVTRTSATWPRIRPRGRFCVNVLSAAQERVSRAFATRGTDRFQGLAWRPAPSGSPILGGVLAWIDCVIEREEEAGDHFLVMARVVDLGTEGGDGPLVFYRGGYGRFGP